MQTIWASIRRPSPFDSMGSKLDERTRTVDMFVHRRLYLAVLPGLLIVRFTTLRFAIELAVICVLVPGLFFVELTMVLSG